MKKLGMAPFILGLAIILGSTTGYADRKHGDVENIGNRSVSGRIFGILPNFVSLEKEIALLLHCGYNPICGGWMSPEPTCQTTRLAFLLFLHFFEER